MKQQPQHHAESIADRLARLRRWCVTGLLAAAELELHGWCRESKCPPAAGVLLARLASQRGDVAGALTVLTDYENRNGSLDAGVLQTLVCLNLMLDRHDQAQHWLAELHEHVGHVHSIQHWIQAMDELKSLDRHSLVDPKTEQLAVELMDHLSVLPSLVASLKLASDVTIIASLRAALNHAFRDIHAPLEQIIACEALAELSLLASDPRDARRWAHRGRRLDPYHVRFALILANMDDDATVGPPAVAALTDALQAFPHYPDVRAALIRREFADGQVTAARRRLRNWLNDQPQHPLAQQLQQELAA